jgi:hypothetical protein
VLWDVEEKVLEVLWIEEKKGQGVLCYFCRSAKAVELPFQTAFNGPVLKSSINRCFGKGNFKAKIKEVLAPQFPEQDHANRILITQPFFQLYKKYPQSYRYLFFKRTL